MNTFLRHYAENDLHYVVSKEATFIEEYGEDNCLNEDQLKTLDLNIFIIEKNLEQIGYFVLYQPRQDSFHLVTMYLNDSERGNGYATKYLKEIINKIKENKNIKKITADTIVSNKESINVFKKLGFDIKNNKDWVKFKMTIA